MTLPPLETLTCRREGPVFRITLDRPEVLNAIDDRMLVELRAALVLAEGDPEARVVCIDGAGERAFSSGIDVAYARDLGALGAREAGRELHRTFLALRTSDLPIVAAIDGLCLGAGLELAISCDLMLATDRSSFGLPNIRRGIPAIVEAALLPAAIGLQGAREMAFTGARWDAERAERRGLINRILAPEVFADEVRRWCEELASRSAIALSTQKEIIHQWVTTDVQAAIEFSINTVSLAFSSREQVDAMSSFLEQRGARGGGRG